MWSKRIKEEAVSKLNVKAFRDRSSGILQDKLVRRLDQIEIKQDFDQYEQRKRK